MSSQVWMDIYAAWAEYNFVTNMNDRMKALMVMTIVVMMRGCALGGARG